LSCGRRPAPARSRPQHSEQAGAHSPARRYRVRRTLPLRPLRSAWRPLRRDLVRNRGPQTDVALHDRAHRAGQLVSTGAGADADQLRSRTAGSPAPRPSHRSRTAVLLSLASCRSARRMVKLPNKDFFVKRITTIGIVLCGLALAQKAVHIDVIQERAGAEPKAFLPMVGNWVVTKDGTK